LCSDFSPIIVDDGDVFGSGSLGTGEGSFETESELLSGSCRRFNISRRLMVNGRAMSCDGNDWAYPMPPQRNGGYCIQVTAGNSSTARFSVW
jgi:hypothetical protein